MNKISKYFIVILLFFSVVQSHAQTVGETIADSNAYRIITNQVTQKIRNKNQQSDLRMPGSILMDQSELINYPGQGFGGANVSAITGQFFGVSVNTSGNFTLADDFTVPAGEIWVIDSILFYNYQTGSTTTSTINNLRLQIRNGTVPGAGNIVFGDLTTNVLHSSYFAGIYRTTPTNKTATNRPLMASKVVPSSLSLNSGTYWLEHQVNGSLASGPFSPLRTLGTTHQVTGNGYQFNTSWIQINELDVNGNNPLNKGISFKIYGTSMPVPRVAEVNGMEYFTLQEAIDAITSNGQEVTLLLDISEAEINITDYSVVIKANGYDCSINQLNIGNGKSFEWIEDTLTITGAINNNTSGVLINKAVIINSSFNNTGIYKGTGQFIGNFTNQNLFTPGN